MTREDVDRMTRKVFDYLVIKFDLSRWYLHLELNSCQCNNHRAQVTIDVNQEEAWINVEWSDLVDVRDLCRCVRHELIHLLAAPFEVPWNQLKHSLGEDERKKAILGIWKYADERHVRMIERVLENTPNLSLDALEKVALADIPRETLDTINKG